jgi:predicted RNA-binding protein with RPS1 domain
MPKRLLSRPWTDALWNPLSDLPDRYRPQTTGLAPDVVRIGNLLIERSLNQQIPAMVPIRGLAERATGKMSGHLVMFSNDNSSRQAAVNGLQSIALRTICTFPARKLQGVFIDPVSMGNTFPFKSLPNFITGQQVFTRSDDVREQLHKLTVHLEQVIQNYLSNRYENLEAYNAEESTIAEAYRYLFVADFPSNFDATACEYLKSLLVNGPRAGVYVVLHVDDTLEKPRDFRYDLFDDHCTVLRPSLGMTTGGSFQTGGSLQKGYVYLGRVTRVTHQGAYVEFLPGKEGFVDTSRLADDRVREARYAVQPGDQIHVRVVDIGRDDKISLTCQGIREDEKQATTFKTVSAGQSDTFWQQHFALTSPNGVIFNVNLDQPPTGEQFEQLAKLMTQAVDEAAKQATAVPLSKFHPEQLWLGNSRREIRAAIGRSGADIVEFWMGNNQDGLVVSSGLLAGKPGAGKSVTLHAIITSLSMQYAPDELELYLLDFKEGVEFQVYVDPERSENASPDEDLSDVKALPHAKLVSIESDREFGLSVLQRVQQEIENRGAQFKASGVSNLDEYRRNNPSVKVPRVLVVIDEFQYMFQESDQITHQLNQIFEDITRRGRAFGVHLLIASQSPNVPNMSRGIYSFIELRMAMQMDQNTAASVLAEGNTDAVDLLDRPGKLIYNIDYGRKGHNVIGQVAKATAEDAKHTLQEIYQFARQREYQRPDPLILFNGNRPTKLSQNGQLARLAVMDQWLSLSALNKQILSEPDWIPQEFPCVAWLGEAMRIGDHTRAIFRRRPRSNMLLVGSSEETIFGILGGMLLSLVHTCQPRKAVFHLLDLSQPMEEENNDWTELSPAFRESFSAYFPVTIGKRFPDPDREIVRGESILQKVHAELEQRQQAREANPDQLDFGPSVFFVCAIGSLSRAQNLRPVVGRRGDEMSPDGEKFLQIVSQGPELGIHTILWLDSTKTFLQLFADSRSTFTHFDLRVGLKMPADDSRQLLGESYAQNLPRMRAYFQDAALATGLEKFKPYAIPKKEEISAYAERFQTRAVNT